MRTPMIIKSSDISSIVNTPRILEEELELDDDCEDFQRTFVERLSRMSFDDCLSDLDEEQEGEDAVKKSKLPDLIETVFDTDEKPLTLVTNLIAQSALDPRSPTIGIDRTPLVFGEQKKTILPEPTNLVEQMEKANERTTDKVEEEKEVEKEELEIEVEEREEVNEPKEPSLVEQKQPEITIDEEPTPNASSEPNEVFVDVGRVIYGTPVLVAANNGPIQQARTPLSCLANRKRSQFAKAAAGGLGKHQQINTKPKQKLGKDNELRVKKVAANPFESNTTPRKLIR